MLSVDLWCIRIILNDAVFTLWLVKHCDYVHLQKTTQSLPIILLDNGTLSVTERVEPLLHFHIMVKTSGVRTCLPREGRNDSEQQSPPAPQTSFRKLELTVSLFQRNTLEMFFFQVFSIFQFLEDVSSICVHAICLCPSSWIARFSNFYLLIFPLCTHQQYGAIELFS